MNYIADQLIVLIKHGLATGAISQWDHHEDYVPEMWRQDVANKRTRLGYWDWVIQRIEAEDTETTAQRLQDRVTAAVIKNKEPA